MRRAPSRSHCSDSREITISPASAKRLAIRRGWQKRPGNDGRARVAIAFERLVPATGDDPSDVTGDKPDASAVVAKKVTGDATGDAASVIGALERHISRLETELDALKQAREAERERPVWKRVPTGGEV